MKSLSPLRYPGGKAAIAGIVRQIRKLNGLGHYAIAEPFAGGAGASLGLLSMEEAPEIYINDLDRSIYNLWWTILNRTQELSKMVRQSRLTIKEWRRQRDIYRTKRPMARTKRAYATFYLNRCNRSGIIVNGGPIGGIKQSGKWKLDARFNAEELVRRIQRIAEFRERINVSCVDGVEFIRRLERNATFYFIDPPYFEKGQTLYLNKLSREYHFKLADLLKSKHDEAWIVTYDDCPEIRAAYSGWARVRPFALKYAASRRRNGREILVAPKWMRLPSSQNSDAVVW